jgi:hypothetical protein
MTHCPDITKIILLDVCHSGYRSRTLGIRISTRRGLGAILIPRVRNLEPSRQTCRRIMFSTGTPFLMFQLFIIHGQTYDASRFAPIKACLPRSRSCPSLLLRPGCFLTNLDLHRHHQGVNVFGDRATHGHGGHFTQI